MSAGEGASAAGMNNDSVQKRRAGRARVNARGTRLRGAARAAYEKKVTLLLAGVPAPRRSRVRAAAAAATAKSGPYFGLFFGGVAVVRWLPRPHLLTINDLCIARLCRPHLRP